MKISRRKLWIYGAIALGVIIILTFVLAPANNKLNRGSTYSRSPDGYGAWYAFMLEKGTPIQRWQKPVQNLISSKEIKPPITLLQIYPQFFLLLKPPQAELTWIEKGNTLVILGVEQPVTNAPFSSLQNSSVGKIKIETTRRAKKGKELLGDRFGTVVWEEKIGQGKIIFVTTPYLAANAYQDLPANYNFLAQLVTQSQLEKNGSTPNQIWVDEYIHGYKDPDVINREVGKNLFSYLSQKPIFIALIQGLILLIIALWADNHRFGASVPLSARTINNSDVYIEALASVLHKAEKSEFVLEVLGKEDQRQLQKALGLKDPLLDYHSLVEIWIQQTGRSATELQFLLQSQQSDRPISETDLLTWLDKCEKIRKKVNR